MAFSRSFTVGGAAGSSDGAAAGVLVVVRKTKVK